ncbi:hypothetical protein USDA257_c16720 [Sinorhizobium fredii USDA 257]|uniref:Uncharacterized protein n=1 Tax=Sinorhizobium fredii (strain USDA 257) TaxID=1185652 RepID=I3X304_SINF2|nr:hypothetical protein USDA257_c16720 [Sinorhizobium fredii USDA 257]
MLKNSLENGWRHTLAALSGFDLPNPPRIPRPAWQTPTPHHANIRGPRYYH